MPMWIVEERSFSNRLLPSKKNKVEQDEGKKRSDEVGKTPERRELLVIGTASPDQ